MAFHNIREWGGEEREGMKMGGGGGGGEHAQKQSKILIAEESKQRVLATPDGRRKSAT